MIHYLGRFSSVVPLFLLLILLSMRLSQASTLSDEGTVYASLGGDVVIPWTLTLDAGSTITDLVWQKVPGTPVAQLLFGGTTFSADNAYLGRVSAVPGSTASIRLTGITEADVGTYRCTINVNDGGTPVRLNDTQDLQILESIENVTVSSNATNSDVEQGESVVLTCSSTGGNPPPSYFWLKDGTTISTTPSNAWIITAFQNQDEGEYSCIASNIAGNVTSSNTVRLTLAAVPVEEICQCLLVVFLCLALWAAILMIAILVTDACACGTCTCMEACLETCPGICICTICKCTCGAVRILACVGPLVGVVLAVVVIILAYVLPNCGNVGDPGFNIIVVVSAVAAAMSIAASIAGHQFEKCCKGRNFPVVTMILEFLLGMMVAIAGIVVSVLYIQEQGTRDAGLALGIVSIFLLGAAFTWFMVRVRCGKKRPSIDMTIVPSDRKVEVHWTARSEGSYKVLYRLKDSNDWTYGPEVSTEDPPNYKYTVDFPEDGTYEVRVEGTIACCLGCLCCLCWQWLCCQCCLGCIFCQCTVTSDIEEVTVPAKESTDHCAASRSSGERSMPV